MTHPFDNDRPTNADAGKIFVESMRGVIMIGCVALGLLWIGQAWIAPELRTMSLTVSIASIAISVAALLPGMFVKAKPPLAGPSAMATKAHVFLVGATAAMAVRFACTVALFVACRYQFGLPTKTIAILVCSWYALLTSVEIFYLARGASAIGSLGFSFVAHKPTSVESLVTHSQTPLTRSTPE